MKRLLFIIVSFFYMIFFNISLTSAENIILNDNMYVTEINDILLIYKDNVIISEINSAKILDFKQNYLIYNSNDAIYLHDISNYTTELISQRAYNAIIFNDKVFYESDKDDTKICKNMIESVHFRNCYKLYTYDILDKSDSLLDLPGKDVYLNDVDDNYLLYTSIHNNDQFCTSLCSYVNLYNLENANNIMIKEYGNIILDMSGNGFLDDNKVIFESIPNIYDCQYAQIFIYDIKENTINIISKDNDACFNENSEIISAFEGYVIFSSKYNNYEDSKSNNYIYSIDDDKYKIIDNKCGYKSVVINDYNSIYCIEENDILIYKIDINPPIINANKHYIGLKEQGNKLINILEYSDDLSSNDNIKIELLSNLSEIGIKEIDVKLCDKYNNCMIDSIIVEIIDVDFTPPKIYCNDLITIKNTEDLDINKYGFAIDNVDGKLTIEIEGKLDYSKGGEFIILLKSVDSSGNVGYKEIELIVYNSISLFHIYYIILFVSIILVIIIYILRVKNKEHI